MIFLSEPAQARRCELAARLDSGSVTQKEFVEGSLEIDPNDGAALRLLARSLQAEGELARAERVLWRGLESNPCDFRFYFMLAGLLLARDVSSPLAAGLLELGYWKISANENAFEEYDREWRCSANTFNDNLIDIANTSDAAVVASQLEERRVSEPSEVGERLYRYRLIDEIEDQAGVGLDRQKVDEILKLSLSLRPLLEGVLRGWAVGDLPEEARYAVEASLAILGETGDPAVLPDLLDFSVLDDEGIAESAKWAIGRVASRDPETALEKLRTLIPVLGLVERASLAERLAFLPPVPGVAEMTASLLEGWERHPKAERDSFFVLVVSALVTARGPRGLELAEAAVEHQSARLKREGRSACQRLIEMARRGEAPPLPAEPDVSVYDICASGFPCVEDENIDEA